MGEYTLIDTSAWILALRKGAAEEHKAEVDMLISQGQAAITGLVLTELLSGAKTQREFRELREGLSSLARFDPTARTWERAAEFAFELRRKGISVPTADVLIMTVAWENECSLLHADRHFELMVQAGVGLKRRRVRSLLTFLGR